MGFGHVSAGNKGAAAKMSHGLLSLRPMAVFALFVCFAFFFWKNRENREPGGQNPGSADGRHRDWVRFRHTGLAPPIQGGRFLPIYSQGVALGFNAQPRWGLEQLLTKPF